VHVARSSQPPFPSQLPLSPQAPGAAAVHAGCDVARGVEPPGMLVHTPALPETRQLWHPFAQALSQHTPSSEHTRPMAQSLEAAHVPPAPTLSPQRLVVLRQVRLLAQSSSEPQVVRQLGLLALHW
jgi:hypothetical protein